jgi:hypothetical protein
MPLRSAARRATSVFETSPAATSALTQRFDSLLPADRMHWRRPLLPTSCMLQWAK